MEGKPIQILKPGNSYLSDFSLKSSKLPPGHPEDFSMLWVTFITELQNS